MVILGCELIVCQLKDTGLPFGTTFRIPPLTGDVNDAVTLATGYDWVSDEQVPYFSDAWWQQAAFAAVPLVSGSVVRVGKKLIRGLDRTVDGNVVRKVSHPIASVSPIARELREEARQIFYSAFPNLAGRAGFQIHHRIPIEWAHLFPNADPNRLANLVGLQREIHEQVSGRWNSFRGRFQNLGRSPTAAEVQDFAREIDAEFSVYYNQ